MDVDPSQHCKHRIPSYTRGGKQDREAALEAHHLVPLTEAVKERKTKAKDLALLCASCHRLLHRAIALEKRWLSVAEANAILKISVTS